MSRRSRLLKRRRKCRYIKTLNLVKNMMADLKQLMSENEFTFIQWRNSEKLDSTPCKIYEDENYKFYLNSSGDLIQTYKNPIKRVSIDIVLNN